MKVLYSKLKSTVINKQKSLSFRLFISYFLLCAIPVIVITTIFYVQAQKSIEESTQNFSKLYISQLNNMINMHISNIDNLSQALFIDEDVIYSIGNENALSTLERININLKINLLMSQYTAQMPYLQGMAIISADGKIYQQIDTQNYLTEADLLDQQWYQKILNSSGKLILSPSYKQINFHLHKPEGLFFSGRLLTDPNGRKAGVVLFLSSTESLFPTDTFKNIDTQNSRVIVLTSDNDLIYDSNEAGAINKHLDDIEIDQDQYFITLNESDSTGIKVIIATPKETLYKDIELYRNMAFSSVGIMLIVIIFISIILSYRITKPITRFIKNMKRVEDGFYHPIQEIESNLEFNRLIQSYNMMIVKIKHLIEDVFKAEIKQNEAEFLALQNQINPHWLYNTLESIRMKAQLSGNNEVATMIRTLGRLFHMALSQKIRPTTIGDELEYVKNYLELQNIRYENRFHLNSDLNEEVLKLPIIKLTFQPIIENSIIHGFLEHDLEYHIHISSQLEHDFLTIIISDDGAGMTEERLQKVRSILASAGSNKQSSISIGLLNVQERLVLNYGEACGLSIDSSEQWGTEVRIKITIKEEDHVQGTAR